MGEKLAKEITEYIEEWCPTTALGRISFIGHSMGGLIIRASLKHLTELKEKMHLYISLSTPHLGYMYNSNRIVDAGIWLLKKWRKFVLDRDLQIRVSGFYHWNELTRSVLSDKLSEDEVPVLNDGLIRVKQVQRAT